MAAVFPNDSRGVQTVTLPKSSEPALPGKPGCHHLHSAANDAQAMRDLLVQKYKFQAAECFSPVE